MLTQAVQLRADETLRKRAILKGDKKILALTSRDIVAAEAHYHCSCYKIYTKVKTKEREHESEKTERDEWYKIVEKQAYAIFLTISELTSFPARKLYQ